MLRSFTRRCHGRVQHRRRCGHGRSDDRSHESGAAAVGSDEMLVTDEDVVNSEGSEGRITKKIFSCRQNVLKDVTLFQVKLLRGLLLLLLVVLWLL